MYKKYVVTKMVLLAIVIAGYGITAGAAPTEAASTQQPSKTLQEAAKAGKMDEVKSFILQSADVNAKDNNGLTALHHAAIRGYKEIVEVLLAKGSDVNAGIGDSNMTAAEFAMWADHADIVKLLAAKGADVTALHLAVYLQDQPQAKSLIADGANVNKPTQYGTTPLNIAVGHGSVDMAKLLVDHGANVNAKDSDGLTPLHYALWEGHGDIAKFLVEKGADVHIQDTDGNTTLQQAIKTGKKGRVEKILSTGVIDVSEKGQTGMTPLHLAVQLSHREIVDILLGKGANPNIKDKDGWTPLHKAIIANQKEIAKLLIEKGTDLDIKDNKGRTLHWWVEGRSHDVDVAVTNISVPLNCNQGESVPVTVSIANQGTRRETFRVTLIEDTTGKEIASKEVALAKGWKDESEDIADLIFDAESHTTNDLGNRVCADGDVNGDGYNDLLINANRWNNDQGRVYLYYGGKRVSTTPDKIFTGSTAGDFFGDQGIDSGDVNNDGYDDVIIGARGHNNHDGIVYIFYGGSDMDVTPDVTLLGEAGLAGYFGLQVVVTDINGDEYDDVLTSALAYDRWRGRAYLYCGGSPMDGTADLIFEGENPGDWFGRNMSISGGGDVNGDGYNDIIIGARNYDPQGDSDTWGRAYLYYGGAPMDAICDKTFTGEDNNDSLGSSVLVADIDQDGFADVLIGARFANSNHGRVYLYWGEANLDNSTPDKIFEGEANSDMGARLAHGFYNNDNYGDFAVGAPKYNDTTTGRVYLFYGNTQDSMDTTADACLDGEYPNDRFGAALSSSDVNKDNYEDILVGAWGYPNGNLHGRAYLYYGPFSATDDITFTWDTTKATPGKHTLKASIAPVAGEEDVADNSMTVEVEVKGVAATVSTSR